VTISSPCLRHNQEKLIHERKTLVTTQFFGSFAIFVTFLPQRGLVSIGDIALLKERKGPTYHSSCLSYQRYLVIFV